MNEQSTQQSAGGLAFGDALPDPYDVIAKLLTWAEHTGGWEAPCWADAAKLHEARAEQVARADRTGRFNPIQIAALHKLAAAHLAATDAGLFDELVADCASPDSINDVCDAVSDEVQRLAEQPA